MDLVFAMAARNPDSPRVAAHFAILNKAADDIGLDVNFDILAAVGTHHNETVVHTSVRYRRNARTHAHAASTPAAMATPKAIRARRTSPSWATASACICCAMS